MNEFEIRGLKEALSAAKLENCCCSEECKKEIRLYLKTFIVGPIEDALIALTNGCKSKDMRMLND